MSDIYKINNDQFIAYKHNKSKRKNAPTVVFFHGFMSDMLGNKASSIYDHCIQNDWSILIFDNLGHGHSSGAILDQTIGGWVDAAIALIDHCKANKLLLVGSSAGAWVSLLVALKLKTSVEGIICIAPAPDFTEYIWDNLSKAQQIELKQTGNITLKEYITISYKLIEEAKNHILLDNNINIYCPIHLIHGLQDKDVPYDISLTLFKKIASDNVILKAIKNGDHRLSRSEDLEVIKNSISEIMKIINHTN